MLFDRVDPASVGVLVLVDEDDGIPVRQNAPELGVFHEGNGEQEDIVVMNGDASIVDAPVPEFVLDGEIIEAAGFGDPFGPMIHLRKPFAELCLKAFDERPAEGVDGIAVDKRTAIGAGLDLVLGDVGEGNACDLLVALRKCAPVAVDEELKRLDQGVGLASPGAGVDEKALPAFKTATNLLDDPLAGLLGRIQERSALNHLG